MNICHKAQLKKTCHEVIRGTRLTFIFTNQEDTIARSARLCVEIWNVRSWRSVDASKAGTGDGFPAILWAGNETSAIVIAIWHDDIWYKHSNVNRIWYDIVAGWVMLYSHLIIYNCQWSKFEIEFTELSGSLGLSHKLYPGSVCAHAAWNILLDIHG